MVNSHKKTILTIHAFLLLLLLWGCGKEKTPTAPPPLDVEVALPLVKPVTEWDYYTGRLEPFEMVEVRSRVSGYLDSIHFEEGRHVEKDQLLFIIDPRPFEAVLNRTQARLAQTQSALNLAQANLKRAEQLIENKAISREELDIRRSEALQAEADVQAAQAEVNSAALELEFTRITAPIKGIISQQLVTVGNLIDGGTSNSTLLTTIVPHTPIYCVFETDEKTFLRGVRRYFKGETPGRGEGGELKVEMQLADEDDFPHKGIIRFVDNQLDPNTATMRIWSIFENKNQFITPGLFARVRVPSYEIDAAILIPDSAIGYSQALKYVWVLGDNNQVEQKFIELGSISDGLRVVRSGLTAEDKIVLNGIQFLRPGTPVTPKETNIEL